MNRSFLPLPDGHFRFYSASRFLLIVILLASPADAGEHVLDPANARLDADAGLRWYDIRQLHVEGQGWGDTEAPYDRLPERARQLVRPPVWSLSKHSAGLCVRFETAAPAIHARWTLTSERLDMPHMPATGVSGLDLYVRDESGTWRWLANGRPAARENKVSLVSGIPEGRRQYLLYLPLYNGVEEVEIGIAQGESLSRLEPPADKPILFYGTSITQGGCASRPGMVHTAILGRWLDRPIINLGFSGNGKMEAELATLIAELDVAAYVIDCLPNMTAQEVSTRVEPLVTTLRQHHPETPILLAEDRTYTNAFLMPGPRQRNATSREALRAAYQRLKQAGVERLYYLDGEAQLGPDGEDTVDGSHPTDLGFYRMAEAFAPKLREMLDQQE